MGSNDHKPTQVLIEIEVPESVRAFVHDWARATGEKENDIVQSIFSHGLTSICAVNDWKPALVDRVAPILEDLCACSGEGTEILHVNLVTDAVLSRGNGTRN